MKQRKPFNRRNIHLALLSVTTLMGLYRLPVLAQVEASFREDFDSLGQWSGLRFPRVAKQSEYELQTEADGRSVLLVRSRGAASAFVHSRVFNPRALPILRWRWRNTGILSEACVDRKACDDYPIRLYVLFPYQPEKASFWERQQYAAAKRIFGQYPPSASLNYVWANSKSAPDVFYESPYIAAAKLFAVERGAQNLGAWVSYERNLVEDYQSAFGAEIPERAQIAVMSDTDNTGAEALAYIDFIEVSTNEQPFSGESAATDAELSTE